MDIEQTQTFRGIGMSMNRQTGQSSHQKGSNMLNIDPFGDGTSKISQFAKTLYSKIPEQFDSGVIP
ncbi:hypothetical protein CYPRO_1301 [Cyclonatronum proteinivorum]|uniref:Uncharacterized protein n=1 Tax=Cyclonatronum proteinivorum TaxID=1457365 RepID=A0A345UJA6_9BACT|nr:hypothetical protein CYPRO_1301 [Cyclonatronum proteinivorum]